MKKMHNANQSGKHHPSPSSTPGFAREDRCPSQGEHKELEMVQGEHKGVRAVELVSLGELSTVVGGVRDGCMVPVEPPRGRGPGPVGR